MELSATEEINIATKSDLIQMQAKIMNALMSWHSPWNLVIDGQQINIDEDLDLDVFLKLMQGFHLKRMVGYGPRLAKNLSFATFRSRHKAMVEISKTTQASGDQAHCQSK